MNKFAFLWNWLSVQWAKFLCVVALSFFGGYATKTYLLPDPPTVVQMEFSIEADFFTGLAEDVAEIKKILMGKATAPNGIRIKMD